MQNPVRNRAKPGAEPRLGRTWRRSGVEPSTADLLTDPIAALLMRADRLTAHDVEAVIIDARRRRFPRRSRDGSRPAPEA